MNHLNSNICKIAYAIAVAFFFSSPKASSIVPSQPQDESIVTLKAGTPIPLATVSTITSSSVSSGSVVDFSVLYDIKVGDAIVIPAGTITKGQVTNIKKPSALGKGGEVLITLNTVNAIDGTLIPLSGATISATGQDNTALAIICGLCTIIGFLIDGKDAEIPAGTNVQAVVMANSTIAL